MANGPCCQCRQFKGYKDLTLIGHDKDKLGRFNHPRQICKDCSEGNPPRTHYSFLPLPRKRRGDR